eukprot:361603-Chlamydomonas_euryale.AAC.12
MFLWISGITAALCAACYRTELWMHFHRCVAARTQVAEHEALGGVIASQGITPIRTAANAPFRVRVTGSGRTKCAPVLSTARREVIKQWAGCCHQKNGTARSPEPPHTNPTRQPGREDWTQCCNSPIPPCGAWPADHFTLSHHPFNSCLTTNASGILAACEPRRFEDVHELPPRHVHLSCRIQVALRPSAHAGDLAQAGVVGADEGLQLLVPAGAS